MQVAGGWQSPGMPGGYTQGRLARRGAVDRLRYSTDWQSPDKHTA